MQFVQVFIFSCMRIELQIGSIHDRLNGGVTWVYYAIVRSLIKLKINSTGLLSDQKYCVRVNTNG